MSAIKRALEEIIANVAKAADVDETMAWIAYDDMAYLGTLDEAKDNAHMESMLTAYVDILKRRRSAALFNTKCCTK